MLQFLSDVFAFWKDVNNRWGLIKEGLGEVARSAALAIGPVLIFVVAAVTVWWFGLPLPSSPLVPFAAVAVLLGYFLAWLPWCVGMARNAKPKIFGRQTTEALGGAHFATDEELGQLNYIGGPSRSNIYLGRLR
jgi:hypothetical protein